MEPRKILIVDDGILKTSENPDHYTSYVEILVEVFDSVILPKDKQSDPDVKAAIVEVIDSAVKAVKILEKNKFDTVIFVSSGMERLACEIQTRYKGTKVLVLTGKPIENKPYIIPKMLLTVESMRRIPRQL